MKNNNEPATKNDIKTLKQEIENQNKRIDQKFDEQDRRIELQFALQKQYIDEKFEDYKEQSRQQHAQLLGAIAEFAGRSEKQDQEMIIRNHTIKSNTKRIEKIETKVFSSSQAQ